MSSELLRQSFEVQGKNFDVAGEVSGEIKMILKGLEINSDHIRRSVVVAFEAEMNVTMYAERGTITLILT